MADQWECLQCGKSIGMWDKQCKYCGTPQYGTNNEFYPGRSLRGKLKEILGKPSLRTKEPIFSEEEAFLYGIHPNDEMYRKTMELDILSKNYNE